jgi:hypothetical protein
MTKFSILKLSLIAAVLTLASTPSTLHAQTPAHQARINVPFAFEVGSEHFAPGTYLIGMLNDITLNVRGAAKAAFASMKSASNSKTAAAGKVVFAKVGDRYFLREVWSSGATDHLVAYETKAEKQAQKLQLAANQPAAQGVEIALAQ